jgi:2'-5' RNA ligase
MRLFLGFMPAAAERQIYGVCQRMAHGGQLPLQWVPMENWHVTAAFLGNVEPQAMVSLDAAVAAVVTEFPPFTFTLSALEWFPSVTKPRLLALRVDACVRLLAFQSELARALRREGFHTESRPYRPHLTLARLKGSRQRFNPPALPPITPFDCRPEELVLFESLPGRRAPVYRPVQVFEMPA